MLDFRKRQYKNKDEVEWILECHGNWKNFFVSFERFTLHLPEFYYSRAGVSKIRRWERMS